MPLDPAFDPDGAATSDTLFGLPIPVDDAAVRVIGVPFEATTSGGRGTAGGPAAVLAASGQVDLHDLETGGAWRQGIAMAPIDPDIHAWNAAASALALPVIAAGGPVTPELAAAAAEVDRYGARVNEAVRAATDAVFDAGAIPAIIGGDHSVPFGAIAAAAARHPGLGLLHIDAHADLRDAYEGFTWSHASILFNVLTRIDGIGPVAQVGLRDVGQQEHRFAEQDRRVHWHTDLFLGDAMADGQTWHALVQRILAPLPATVWVTFDIDGLDPSLCPHTGTPVPGGLTWREALVLLRALVDSGRRIVGFDLVEVADQPWDAAVGARLLYKLAGHAIASTGRAREGTVGR